MSSQHDPTPNLRFHLETLESRMMLSTVQVFASGDTGAEQFALRIDGEVVQQFSADQQLQAFTFETPETISASQIRVEFLNDDFDAAQQLDRNLRVDRIQIDGTTFQTEDISVFSNGTYTSADGLVPGNGRGEVLHTNGFFQYANQADGSVIEISARGDEGNEQFNLIVRGNTVRTFTAPASGRTFVHQTNGTVSADDIRIEFTNDQYNPSIGLDSNLNVDFIRIDGQTFQTESPDVFSTGTFLDQDGIVAGNGRGETLNVNGFFQYSSGGTGSGSGSTVEIRARGSEGGEQFNLEIAGEVVGTFTATTSDQIFQFQADRQVSADEIRVEFVNDLFDSALSLDRNLTVDFLRVDGTTFQTEASTVLSTGTWTPQDGVARGFGRGDTLHANGFFDFAALEETARYRVTFDATWSAATHPNQFPSAANFSGLIGSTHNDDIQFWTPGTRASAGIEDVAETGSKTIFSSEINSAINAGTAENELSGGGITLSPDSVTLEFDVTSDFSLVTLVSMLAPSPDWFVGVHGLSLVDGQGWINNETISLDVYDAGTDDGVTFTSADIDNNSGTISRITGGPLANNGTVAPVGTFSFERIG